MLLPPPHKRSRKLLYETRAFASNFSHTSKFLCDPLSTYMCKACHPRLFNLFPAKKLESCTGFQIGSFNTSPPTSFKCCSTFPPHSGNYGPPFVLPSQAPLAHLRDCRDCADSSCRVPLPRVSAPTICS